MTTTTQALELFIFDFCPFAQRIQMSLIHAKLDYKQTILKPGNLPDDFGGISPLGNVPVLRVNGLQAIFESAVINDYIAQISAIKMEPEDEVERAQMRAWSEYGASCLGASMQVLQAPDELKFKQANQALIAKFDVLSKQLKTAGPFFFGEQYTTIDSTYAPLFLRMQTLSELTSAFSLDGLPENIQSWMHSLLNSKQLKQSILGDFPRIYRDFIGNMASGKYLDKHLG